MAFGDWGHNFGTARGAQAIYRAKHPEWATGLRRLQYQIRRGELEFPRTPDEQKTILGEGWSQQIADQFSGMQSEVTRRRTFRGGRNR